MSRLFIFPLPTLLRVGVMWARETYITDLNKAVDGFNLDGFMADFERTGALWTWVEP